ncbi:hypothetical protein OMP43_03745 [Sphingomonas sp. CBMAI 2297]|uniref:hypothetical protein n=1 Tax=Sphingomonas sp. CBMAI 2297 TaxID=2991720 RepID=UPI002453A3B1|nr:hypothetical protein [Sphingomonas sp. CBMAI 2297]MDH4743128.1 hypothetical protein [Sphingomonas sp. CBMAI 2297]
MKSRTRPKSICHAPECAEEISCGKLMCRPHWFALPRPLRQAISSAWKERRLADWSANCLEARRLLATTQAPATRTTVTPERAFEMNARITGERIDN